MKSEDIKLYVANFKNYVDNLSENELEKYIDKWKKQNKNMKSARELFEELDFYITNEKPLTYQNDDGGYITQYLFNPTYIYQMPED